MNFSTIKQLFALTFLLIPVTAWSAVLIEVQAGNYARLNTPLSLDLKTLDVDPEISWLLQEVSGPEQNAIPCQVSGGESPHLEWILAGKTPPGAVRRFRLIQGTSDAYSQVRVDKDDSTLTLSVRDRNVLRYHHGLMPPPAGSSKRFERSSFIHPLWSPAGTVLSRIHPPDHIHHMGLWAPWTRTRYHDQSIDFWNLNQGQGTVRFDRFLQLGSGPVRGGFTARQNHVWLQASGGEKTVLHETLSIQTWNTGPSPSNGWLVDYRSIFRCATTDPILLEAYRYGGLGLRATALWHNQNSDYLTSEGKSRADGDGTRARWCDVFGQTDQGTEGVLFMSHPQNREHPEPMRIWPSSANGGRENVFFNFCPIRHQPWNLLPGRDYPLKYRLYLHTGVLKKERAEQLWRDFAEPPVIRVLEN